MSQVGTSIHLQPAIRGAAGHAGTVPPLPCAANMAVADAGPLPKSVSTQVPLGSQLPAQPRNCVLLGSLEFGARLACTGTGPKSWLHTLLPMPHSMPAGVL